MKKFLVLFIIILFSAECIFADDFFDSYSGIDHAWDGQKPITNQEFEKAIETLQSGQKKKEEKQRKKKIKKLSGGGTSLHSGLNPLSEIQSQAPLTKKDDEGQLLNIPVDIVIDGTVLERGFYNVYGEKNKNNEIYISLYQAHYLKGKVKAVEIQDDYDAETINFAKIIPYNDSYIQVIYGSLDFNATALIPCLQN